MRWIGLLILSATGLAAADTSLDQSRVTLSYGELRQLLAAAQKPPVEEPPVAAAILAADYDLTLEGGAARGSATFQLQTFRDGAQVLPLLGATAKIERVEPAETVLIQRDGKYAVVLEGKLRQEVTLHFSLALGASNSGWQGDLSIPAAALSAARIRNIKPDEIVVVENASLHAAEQSESRWQLGAITSLKISRQEKPKAAAEPVADLPRTRVVTPAIVRSTANETRIVRDGSYINTALWAVRHETEMNWTLTLPEGCQLLSCNVEGEAVSPLLQDARTIVIPLPIPRSAGESRIAITYTGKKAAFDPVRGEFSLELPATALLVESLSWELSLPQPYETVAIQGNVDFLPADKLGQIKLTRELGRGDAPTVHVFYQKPETTAKK